MKVVAKAIMDVRTTALKAAVTGMYLNDPPQNTALPYIVFFFITDLPQDTFNTFGEKIRIQFSIFSGTRSSEEASDIYELLKTCYDYCTLTVGGYSHIEMRRVSANLMREPDDAAWHYRCDYDVLIQKP